MSNREKMRGSALITALFVVAILSLISVNLILQDRINIRQSQLIFTSNQAFLFSQGAEAWAKGILSTKATNQVENFPKSFSKQLDENIHISAKLIDAQGLFNLNNLSQIESASVFIHLIMNSRPGHTQPSALQIANNAHAFILPNSNPTLINRTYMAMNPPYTSSLQNFVDTSELRLVSGVTPDLYQSLSPFITTLPEVTAININTAPVQVIASILQNGNLVLAKQILDYRKQHNGFRSLDDFDSLPIVTTNPPLTEISVESNYFLLYTWVTMQHETWFFKTLLKRVNHDNKYTVLYLMRSRS